MTTSVRMAKKDRSHMTERILSLTLEIIYLLTGEDYKVEKKTSGELLAPSSRLHGPPITASPPYSLMSERKEEFLEVVNKMIELLIGESEELVVVKKEKEETYVRSGQQCTEEGDMMRTIKEEEEEICVWSDQQSMKEGQTRRTIKAEPCPVDINTAGRYFTNISEGCLISPPDENAEDNGVTQYSPGEIPITGNTHHRLYQEERSPDHFISKKSSVSHPITSVIPMGCYSMDRSPDPSNLALPSKCCSKTYSFIPNTIPTSPSAGKSNVPLNAKASTSDILSIVREGGDKIFQCPECDKCFRLKSTLVLHHRLHTGERPYSCSECGKGFIQKRHLLVHRRSHTGERPYSCSECGRCFTWKEVLVRHQKTHTGERPFSCSECGKGFIQKGELLVHLRTHTGERPYSCSECGKCFARKQSLLMHQLGHTGKLPASCSARGK